MRRWRSKHQRRRARLAITVALLGASVATTTQPMTALASGLRPTGCVWTLGYLPPVSEVMSGTMQLPGRAGSVAIGTGPIDWNIATKHGLAWAKGFMSLDWTLSAVHMYVMRGGAASMLPYLHRAEQVAADFIAHIPVGGGPEPAATWSAMYAGQRADVFGCLASVDPTFTPAIRELRAMGPWLADPRHDPGNWNQGVDFRLGGLAAGCVTRNTSWATLARDKLGGLAASTIDPQGAPYEQAVGYGSRLVTVFTDTATQLSNCFGTSSTVFGARLRALRGFLSWATQPDGLLSVLGDSSFGSADGGCAISGEIPGPAQTGTWKVFTAGYAFGRTSWASDPTSQTTSGFATSGYYTLRFGPGRVMHGHDDHQSVTWYARSSPLIVDSGYVPLRSGFTTYSRLPEAHNVLTEPGVTFTPSARTTLVRSRMRTAWQSYELTDTAYGGRPRVRDVLIDLTAGIVVVEDRASRAHAGVFTQLWHLPADAAVSVSRTGIAGASRCPDTTMWISPMPLRGQTIALHSTGVVKGQKSPYQGWVDSQATDDVQAAPVVILRRAGTTARILTILTVGAHSVRPRITRTWSSTGGYLYTISNGGKIRHVRLDNTGLLTEA